ncbi:MAG: hypothetical protein P4L86_03070 [Mycobacterium sp.]|nr:hypothetical protein [Mycobacterium sp.]
MKQFGYAAIVVGAMVAGTVGFAVPAMAAPAPAPAPTGLQAIVVPTGVDHLSWLDDVHQGAKSPKVDTDVHQSR